MCTSVYKNYLLSSTSVCPCIHDWKDLLDLQGSGGEEGEQQFCHREISGGYSGEGGGGKEDEDGRLVTFVACDTIVCLSVVTNQFRAWTYTESKCSFLSNVLFMSLYAHQNC